MNNGTNGKERRGPVYSMDSISQIQTHTTSAFEQTLLSFFQGNLILLFHLIGQLRLFI